MEFGHYRPWQFQYFQTHTCQWQIDWCIHSPLSDMNICTSVHDMLRKPQQEYIRFVPCPCSFANVLCSVLPTALWRLLSQTTLLTVCVDLASLSVSLLLYFLVFSILLFFVSLCVLLSALLCHFSLLTLSS